LTLRAVDHRSGPARHGHSGGLRNPSPRRTRSRAGRARTPNPWSFRACGMAASAAKGRIHSVGGERRAHQRPVLMPAPRACTNHSAQRHSWIKGMSSYSVRRSPVHGRGLFARTPYRRGEWVGEYRGRVIDVALESEKSRAWKSDPAYTLLFALDEGLTVEAGVKGNSSRVMTRSCTPSS